MPTNAYFNQFSYAREQDLIEDLVIESIKQYGIDVRYIPRTYVDLDTLYGEDDLSRFNDAVELEMYIKNIEGFEGEGDFIGRFGLEIRDEMTLTVARKRFDEARVETIISETGYNLHQESANTDSPSRQNLSNSFVGYEFLIEEGTTPSEGYAITHNRPLEGDLIYFPLTRNLFEIKFVEHEVPFYQFGSLQTYDLKVELFEYSSEIIATGNTEIDNIQDESSQDLLPYFAITLEANNGVMLGEDGDEILQQYSLANNTPTSDNDYIQSQANTVNDWSEDNPFGDDRY